MHRQRPGRRGGTPVFGGLVALALLAGIALSPSRARAAADFVVTAPGFFFAVNGGAAQNPTLTLTAGQTYQFDIQTGLFHPFWFTTDSTGLVAFTDGVSGNVPTSAGTVSFTPPLQAADYTLYYVCALHFFFGQIDVKRPVAGDADADGVPDASDNCPAAANAGQEDRGGLGAGSPPDGSGDACQCGDVNADGRVTLADAVVITRSLLQPATATLTKPELCDVGGAASPSTQDCTLSDAVIVRRALLQPPTASIQQVCAPAGP